MSFTSSILDTTVPSEVRDPLIPNTANTINRMTAAPLGLTNISTIPTNISIINSAPIMSSTIFSNPPPTYLVYSIIPRYLYLFVGPFQSAMVRGIIEEYKRKKYPASCAEIIQSPHTNPPSSSKILATNSVSVLPTIPTQNTQSYTKT